MSTVYEEIFSVNRSLWNSLGVNRKELTNEQFDEIVQKDKTDNLNKIKEMLSSGVCTFINDHNGAEETLQAVVILDDNYICPVGMYTVWCLNKLYVGKDEKIHLSRTSVAGLFGQCASRTDGTKESFMNSAMEWYNKNADDCANNRNVSVRKISSYIIVNK